MPSKKILQIIRRFWFSSLFYRGKSHLGWCGGASEPHQLQAQLPLQDQWWSRASGAYRVLKVISCFVELPWWLLLKHWGLHWVHKNTEWAIIDEFRLFAKCVYRKIVEFQWFICFWARAVHQKATLFRRWRWGGFRCIPRARPQSARIK